MTPDTVILTGALLMMILPILPLFPLSFSIPWIIRKKVSFGVIRIRFPLTDQSVEWMTLLKMTHAMTLLA